MDCDRYEVLYKVVRIAHCTTLDFPHSCKSILRFLARSLKLQAVSLRLLDSRQKNFSRAVHDNGPDCFLPCSRLPAPGPETVALASRQPVRHEGGWLFPIAQGKRVFGLLHLITTPGQSLPEGHLQMFKVIGEEIARLVEIESHREQERQQLLHLTLLAELGRRLNQVRSLEDLQEILPILLLQGGVAAALRPLFEGAAASRAFLHCRPQQNQHRTRLAALEEKHFPAALASGKPVFRRFRGAEGDGEAFPPGMVIVPLILQQQMVGVLTLFGGGAADLLFASGHAGRRFLTALGAQLAHALEGVHSRGRLEALSLENDRKLREATLLYRISRAIHSTLRLNELMHLILSAAVSRGGGGFERAMLFTLNERTQTLQGMLCVTRETAGLVLPPGEGERAWDRPMVTDEARQAQRDAAICRRVMKQRLPLDPQDNALARAIRSEQVIFIPEPAAEPPSGTELAAILELGPYACAPLLGRHRPLGVLLVDNPESREPMSADRQRFLELFANQAGSAMENSMLLHRLETAHQDLRETQERLIQGEKMAVLGEMAASIAHEMRNPLVPLGGFAQRLARRFPEGSREAEYTEIIVREVQRLEEMLSNVLAFSRKQMLCFNESLITDILEEALDLEHEALDRAAIEVVREIDPDLPYVQCDEKKMRQVLINLLTNARQAMADGGTLAVRAYRTILRGEEGVAIEIEDSGGGISAEVLHNIFNPFFTTKEKGTGLGLSISHRIIEHHRGEIEVKNRERGVVFTIRLPAHLPSPASH